MSETDVEVEADVVVVGSGVAGCTAALSASEHAEVAVVTKASKPEDSTTRWAQGGVATPASDEDADRFVEDVLEAGAGEGDRDAVETLVSEGEAAVEEFLAKEVGVEFDRTDGEFHRTREGGHSRDRVIHRGDATGEAVHLALLDRLDRSSVEVLEGHTVIDLVEGGGVVAVSDGEPVSVSAGATVLATGGIGDVYGRSTNPPGTTGDGVAMAALAGAEVDDMEYVQFHPTVHAERGFLLSEALRGEGALVVAGDGERFLDDYHEDAELAPRDVVAAAVYERSLDDDVYLDIRPVQNEMEFEEAFPTAADNLDKEELEGGLVPVSPAEHFLCGGVTVDERGRTTVDGLYAAGETACTGVHGANRLASTSLLEGLVWGMRAGEAAAEEHGEPAAPEDADSFNGDMPEGFVESKFDRLQEIMWNDVGLRRSGEGLERARRELRRLRGEVRSYARGRVDSDLHELRNAVLVGLLVTDAALENEDTVGAHRRVDA